MSDLGGSPIDGLDRYRLEIDVEAGAPLAFRDLAALLLYLDNALQVSITASIEATPAAVAILAQVGLTPFDAALTLVLVDVQHASWHLKAGMVSKLLQTTIAGNVVLGTIGGVFANNLDRFLQAFVRDMTRYFESRAPAPMEQPFEHACLKAMEAAERLKAGKVTCTFVGPNGFRQQIEITRPVKPGPSPTPSGRRRKK